MPATIGLDIAKRFFQLHTVDPDTGEICKTKLRRTEMVPFFANHAASIIAMEACGSSHHWARTLRALGHEVRLMATKFVRPYVKNNKTDAADARAIWEAAQRPEMRFVPVKTEHQQAICRCTQCEMAWSRHEPRKSIRSEPCSTSSVLSCPKAGTGV